MSKDVNKHKLSIVKATRRVIDFYMEQNNLFRLQASCPITVTECPRWFKSLFFEFEGIMKKYGPEGDDYMLYARTRK